MVSARAGDGDGGERAMMAMMGGEARKRISTLIVIYFRLCNLHSLVVFPSACMLVPPAHGRSAVSSACS
eukprot:727249-Hanusia_phi.AAC.8